MKVFVGIFVLVAISLANGEEKYTTKYDNIDLDQIIKSDRLMMNYVNCLLEKGRCSPDANELKKFLPDALKTGCTKCSEKQKEGSRKIIHHLIKNKRQWWDALEKKYDPERTYVKRYEQELKNEGINL